MANFLIRATTVADIAAITAIYAEYVVVGTASFEIEAPDAAEMFRRWRATVDGGYPFIVAMSEGEILGFAYAGPYRTRAAFRHTVEDSIYLDPKSRGTGVGGALLRSLIEECEKRGFRQMVAVIGDSANAASIRLHKAAGFALVGTLTNVGYKHKLWLDSVLMQRALGPGAETPPTR